MRISHSGRSTFKSCGEKFRLHYIEKLRGPKIYSSLFFGGALDEAFSRMLLDKKLMKTEEEQKTLQFTPEAIFLKHMERVNSNGADVEVAQNINADYYTSDFTEELLNEAAIEKLRLFAPDVDDYKAFMEEAKTRLKAKKKLSEDDLKLYNYATWLTLIEKGLLMIEAYREQVLPQIFEVYSIQEEVSLKNEDGDELTGKIDFTCSFVDEPGTVYVCDNKSASASKPYKLKDTEESEQLATYCEYKDTTKAAYVVVEKKLHKKAPVIHTQILRADVLEETFSHTFAAFEEALYSISTGKFEKNFKSCFEYGRMCPYFKKCKHNNSDGLIQIKKEAPVE